MMLNMVALGKTYKRGIKDYINKYIKDETYRKNKTKEPSLIKILAGVADNKYDYEYRQKKREIVQKQLSWF